MLCKLTITWSILDLRWLCTRVLRLEVVSARLWHPVWHAPHIMHVRSVWHIRHILHVRLHHVTVARRGKLGTMHFCWIWQLVILGISLMVLERHSHVQWLRISVIVHHWFSSFIRKYSLKLL